MEVPEVRTGQDAKAGMTFPISGDACDIVWCYRMRKISTLFIVASAAFARPSGELAERAGSPIIQGIAAAEGGHMIPSQGAVPIIKNGVLEGACGVGGGTAQQDEDCARAGVAKL